MHRATRRFALRAGAHALGALALAHGRAAAAPARGKIFDTHIHLYEVSRPGGVPWPKPSNRTLYKDMTAKVYRAVARRHGITAAGIVEASPLHEDNLRVLAATKDDPLFRFLVAHVKIGAADFPARLDELARDARVVGVRAFLWNSPLTLDATQLEHLRELARRGMTLDVISRGTLNPKPQLLKLVTSVPGLRLIINHLGGARGDTPDAGWTAEMKALAAHPQVHVKLSSLFDMWNPKATEDAPWAAPRTPAAYQRHLDVLLAAFGPERVVFGSNWPVVELGGGIGPAIALTEALLAPLGRATRDAVMHDNATRFYQRVPAKT